MSGHSATLETYDGSTPLDNDRHELFCHEYLVDFNGKEAYIRAGYSANGAKQNAFRLMTDDDFINVRVRLAYLKNQRIQRAEKTGDDVLKELECIGFSRIGRIMTFNESGATFTNSPETLDDDDHAAIESIKVTEDHYGNGEGAVLKTEVKLHPKLPALKELAKHHGVCQADVNMTLNGESLPEGITINFVSAKKESE